MSFPILSSDVKPPPLKKRASLLLPPQKTISSLPDDLLLSCLARVPRLYYPTLSLVSKKFRRLLASREIYKVRSLLGRTEACLHVSFGSRLPDPHPKPSWFILGRKPDAKTKKKKSFGYVLATIPIPHSPHVYWEGMVAFGSNIYAIGPRSYSEPPSSSVSILDCRSHTWHEGPSMHAKRKFMHANVCDGKIYVAGGIRDENNPSNWMEVYDPETQTWETVFCPFAEKYRAEKCMIKIDKSGVIEGEIFFIFSNLKGLAYKPKEDTWTCLGVDISSDCTSTIDGILYSYCDIERTIKWYDYINELWVNVIGLNGLRKIPKYSRAKLVCYGGKMVVLWLKNKPKSGGDYKTVGCAVIALEKRNNNEIWGNVESIDEDVLTVPKNFALDCALTVNI